MYVHFHYQFMLTLLCQLPLQRIEKIVIPHILKFILTLCYESMSTSIAEFETKYIRLKSIYINFVMPTYINFAMSTSIAKFETNYSILMSVYVNFVMLTSIAEYEKNVITPSLKFILTLCMSTSIAKFGTLCSRLIWDSMLTLLCQLPLQNMKLNVITPMLNIILTWYNKNISTSIISLC